MKPKEGLGTIHRSLCQEHFRIWNGLVYHDPYDHFWVALIVAIKEG